MQYDAVLLVSFGGPETREDVLPFLENVLRGRNVPRERMLEVAEHYYHFGGKSPINHQNRLLLDGLRALLKREGPDLPVYWGNRNWAPFLADAVAEMKRDGVRNALAFVTSAYSSYSGCRQYRENIEEAREKAGAGAPRIDKLRVFYNHPGFIEPMAESVTRAVESLPPGSEPEVIFTAHSIPISMASTSCYRQQMEEASRLVAVACGLKTWSLAWQSPSENNGGKRGPGSNRFPLGSHGSAVRSRRRSPRGLCGVVHPDGARRNGGIASAIPWHDTGINSRTHG
jgi:ferrochelatase